MRWRNSRSRFPRLGRTLAGLGLLCLAGAVLARCESSSGLEGGDVVIQPDTATILAGQSVQLTAVNGTGTTAWSSSDDAIATVVAVTGYVTGVAAGTAVISAVSGAGHATATIHVTAPPTLALTPDTVAFGAAADSVPATQTVAVTNSGGGTLAGLAATVAYAAGQPTGWLTATLDQTTAPATLTLRADLSSLALGTYAADVAVASPGASNSPQQVHVTAGGGISFSRDVLPIFSTSYTNGGRKTTSCTACHSSGGIPPAMTYQGLVGGGFVVAGDPDGSSLVQSLESTTRPMPPSGPPLPQSVIAIIRAWIAQGAPDN